MKKTDSVFRTALLCAIEHMPEYILGMGNQSEARQMCVDAAVEYALHQGKCTCQSLSMAYQAQIALQECDKNKRNLLLLKEIEKMFMGKDRCDVCEVPLCEKCFRTRCDNCEQCIAAVRNVICSMGRG